MRQNRRQLLHLAIPVALLAIVGYQWYLLSATPVRLLNCGIATQDCFVIARYRSLDDCQRANRLYHSANCNIISEPGKMTCLLDQPSSIARSYCTQ